MAASCAAVWPARPVALLLLMASAPVMVSPALATFRLFLGVLVGLVCTVGEVTRPDYRINIIICGGILRGRGDSKARDPIVAYGKCAGHGVACLGNLHAVLGVDIGLYRLNTRTAALHIRPVDAHLISSQVNISVWCVTTGCGVSFKDHMEAAEPLTKTLFTFHVYCQVRRTKRGMPSTTHTTEGRTSGSATSLWFLHILTGESKAPTICWIWSTST